MRKVLIILLATILLAGCSTQQRQYDYGEQRAMDYVSDMITRQGFEVKNIDVIKCDTLISDEYLEKSEFEIKLGSIKVIGGEMPRNEYRDFLIGVIEHAHDINFAWFENKIGQSHTNDSLRNENKYVFMPVYTVRAETSSKMEPNMEFRILSDRNGNPRCTDEEFLKSVDNFREKAEVIYSTMY